MLPTPQNFASGSQPQQISSFPVSGTFLPQSQHASAGFLPHPQSSGYLGGMQTQDGLLQSSDPNSPEAFRQSVRLALEEVSKLQILARTALSSIQNAYQPGNAPSHTQADIARLQGQIILTIETLRNSGVGALPVISDTSHLASSSTPSEKDLISNTNRSLKMLYDKVQKSQESAADVGNLLGLDREGGASSSGTFLGGRTASETFRKT